MFRKQIILRITAVEQEFGAAVLAVSELLRNFRDDPTILHGSNVAHAHVRACRDNSEMTYLVRMFAVFEESLRDVRRAVFNRDTPIKTYDLLQQCAARQNIPHLYIADAHTVREYRNALVHGGDAAPVSVAVARPALCKFFKWMPSQW